MGNILHLVLMRYTTEPNPNESTCHYTNKIVSIRNPAGYRTIT